MIRAKGWYSLQGVPTVKSDLKRHGELMENTIVNASIAGICGVEAAPLRERDASTTELCRSGRNPRKDRGVWHHVDRRETKLKVPIKILTGRMTGSECKPYTLVHAQVKAGKGVARGNARPVTAGQACTVYSKG